MIGLVFFLFYLRKIIVNVRKTENDFNNLKASIMSIESGVKSIVAKVGGAVQSVGNAAGTVASTASNGLDKINPFKLEVESM
jgi:phage-related protein